MKFTTTTAFTASLLAAGAMGFHPAAVPEDDPSEITLTGVVRDFQERTAARTATPDFERRPERRVRALLRQRGRGARRRRQARLLGRWLQGRTPSGEGRRNGRHDLLAISSIRAWATPRAAPGASDSGGIQDDESFRLWYRDDPRVNRSKLLELTLNREADGSYVFDSDAGSP